MNILFIVLLALAAARATRLVVDDLLPFGPLRDRLNSSRNTVLQHIGYGLSCTFCVSVWAGGISSALAQEQGWASDGFWVWAVLAFAIAESIVLVEFIIEVLVNVAKYLGRSV